MLPYLVNKPYNTLLSIPTTLPQPFRTDASMWALVKTNPAREFIEGVNIENGLNTDFYIRYNSAIPLDKQLWVEYKDVLFKITNTDNIDKMDNIVRLRSTEKGDKNINANKR